MWIQHTLTVHEHWTVSAKNAPLRNYFLKDCCNVIKSCIWFRSLQNCRRKGKFKIKCASKVTEPTEVSNKYGIQRFYKKDRSSDRKDFKSSKLRGKRQKRSLLGSALVKNRLETEKSKTIEKLAFSITYQWCKKNSFCLLVCIIIKKLILCLSHHKNSFQKSKIKIFFLKLKCNENKNISRFLRILHSAYWIISNRTLVYLRINLFLHDVIDNANFNYSTNTYANPIHIRKCIREKIPQWEQQK